ncbi:hypothetical protein GN156_33270 [bacterium LRH843]|nr:hypothetical protein [bacterium LRH843]
MMPRTVDTVNLRHPSQLITFSDRHLAGRFAFAASFSLPSTLWIHHDYDDQLHY